GLIGVGNAELGDLGDGRRVDASLFERSAEVVDQVIAVDLDDFVVAAAGFVVKEDPGEVGVHGGHHDQGEHDQADHDHRHAGAEAGGERVGDAGANGREDAPEPGAHARD